MCIRSKVHWLRETFGNFRWNVHWSLYLLSLEPTRPFGINSIHWMNGDKTIQSTFEASSIFTRFMLNIDIRQHVWSNNWLGKEIGWLVIGWQLYDFGLAFRTSTHNCAQKQRTTPKHTQHTKWNVSLLHVIVLNKMPLKSTACSWWVMGDGKRISMDVISLLLHFKALYIQRKAFALDLRIRSISRYTKIERKKNPFHRHIYRIEKGFPLLQNENIVNDFAAITAAVVGVHPTDFKLNELSSQIVLRKRVWRNGKMQTREQHMHRHTLPNQKWLCSTSK